MNAFWGALFIAVCCNAAQIPPVQRGSSSNGLWPDLVNQMNSSAQMGVQAMATAVDLTTGLVNSTVDKVTGQINKVSESTSTAMINGIDKVGDLTKDSMDTVQNTIIKVGESMNSIPIIGNLTKYPNMAIGAAVDMSINGGKQITDVVTGTAELAMGAGNAMTNIVGDKVAAVTSAITGKVNAATGKVEDAVSKGIGNVAGWLEKWG